MKRMCAKMKVIIWLIVVWKSSDTVANMKLKMTDMFVFLLRNFDSLCIRVDSDNNTNRTNDISDVFRDEASTTAHI